MDKRKRKPSFLQACPQCGNQFKVWPSKPRRFCSLPCKYEADRTARTAYKLRKGYRVIYVGRKHPMADGDGNCYEHRIVMARKLDRFLERDEHVHHINGDRLDNRPENLQLVAPGEHHRIHKTLKRWSTHHDACVKCGGTDRRHAAYGRCARSDRRERYEDEKRRGLR